MHNCLCRKTVFISCALMLFILVFLSGPAVADAAGTTLSAVDIVILEFNENGAVGFTFMPLVDLAAGTVIHFTDYGWNATSSSFNTVEEGNTVGGGNMITYTAPSLIQAGTLSVRIQAMLEELHLLRTTNIYPIILITIIILVQSIPSTPVTTASLRSRV